MVATDGNTSIVLFARVPDDRGGFVPREREKYLDAVTEAARAYHASGDTLHFADQFSAMLEALSDWIRQHQNRIGSAYLTIRENDIRFVVMQQDKKFDRELTEALTELDLELANREEFELIRLNTLAIPAVSPESATAFSSIGSRLHLCQLRRPTSLSRHRTSARSNRAPPNSWALPICSVSLSPHQIPNYDQCSAGEGGSGGGACGGGAGGASG